MIARPGVFGATVASALFALVAVASAQYGGGGTTPGSGSSTNKVNANGNPFSGGLSFTPRNVSVKVGDVVQWTNTDGLVPHTATEDHNLWDLGGSYGATPANPPGFGPGESVEREFEAGTFSYFCRVHPDDMKGSVSVPVKLRRKRHGDEFRVIAIWSETALREGLVFDVEKRQGGGPWHTVRQGTSKLRGRFRALDGQTLRFRARVRKAEESGAASGYSPAAKIKL